MSNYQQYLTDTSLNPEIADYGVEDFIDDVEETLNLKGKGYIACLKKIMFDAKETIILKKQIEEDKKHLDSLVKNMVCHYDKELNELKASEQLASHVATVNAEDIVALRKENEELKEQVEELDKLKKELKQELLEGVKLHNANHLYKGFVCSHVIEKLRGDIDCVGDGQVDINGGNWLGLFYVEKFYEEIIPEIIKEITEHKEVGSSYEDGYWYYSWADKYELEYNGGGCISYTRIEDTSDEE